MADSHYLFEMKIFNLSFLNMIFKLRCRDGYVKVYINGQEEEHHYDKHDYMFCGKKLLKKEIVDNFSERLRFFLGNCWVVFSIVVLAETKTIIHRKILSSLHHHHDGIIVFLQKDSKIYYNLEELLKHSFSPGKDSQSLSNCE